MVIPAISGIQVIIEVVLVISIHIDNLKQIRVISGLKSTQGQWKESENYVMEKASQPRKENKYSLPIQGILRV